MATYLVTDAAGFIAPKVIVDLITYPFRSDRIAKSGLQTAGFGNPAGANREVN